MDCSSKENLHTKQNFINMRLFQTKIYSGHTKTELLYEILGCLVDYNYRKRRNLPHVNIFQNFLSKCPNFCG